LGRSRAPDGRSVIAYEERSILAVLVRLDFLFGNLDNGLEFAPIPCFTKRYDSMGLSGWDSAGDMILKEFWSDGVEGRVESGKKQ